MKELIEFLNQSYTCYHAIKNIETKLQKNGFIKLMEKDEWQLEKGHQYYIIRNSSSIVAFKIPQQLETVGFHIVASHSDSPSYKLKPHPTIKDIKNKYTKLNTEGYGGMIAYSWFDRPLGIAGRIFVESENKIKEILVNLDETIVIPSLAVHFNRTQENNFNPQIDMLPLLGSSDQSFEEVLLKYTKQNNILSTDLFLYNKEEAQIVGSKKEYLFSSRLDDLECAYICVDSLIKAKNQNIAVCAVLNNEEVGSVAANAADSSFVQDVLERIASSFQLDFKILLANSLLVSADNAHAVHPNHPEKSDLTNMVYMNEGIVIKHQAGLKYTTDGLSEAIFKKMCKDLGILYQDYTNRSDQRGGSTLGAILQSHISIPSIDIGLAQLAMHSTVELAGVKDIEYMLRALIKYYESKVMINEDEIVLN